MRKDLLLKLADLLDTVEEQRFRYDEYFKSSVGPAVKVGECGTVACALGWATTIPETGLEMRRVEPGPDDKDWDPDINECPYRVVLKDRRADRGTNWTTMLKDAAVAFDINIDQAHALFSPGHGYRLWTLRDDGLIDHCGYVRGDPIHGPEDGAGPREVAAWIRRLVEVFEEEGVAR